MAVLAYSPSDSTKVIWMGLFCVLNFSPRSLNLLVFFFLLIQCSTPPLHAAKRYLHAYDRDLRLFMAS